MTEIVRIVNKLRYNVQHFVSIPQRQTPLVPSSVRVKTVQIALTSNNLSYCLGGEILHWWSTFPIPPDLTSFPATEFGISVGWGVCIVMESSIEGIERGRFVQGMLPLSSHSVDLLVRQTETVPGHFIEISPHRNKLLNLYQRYTLLPPDIDPFSLLNSWKSILKVAEAGSSIAKFIFPQDGSKPIHPLGVAVTPWTEKEANLDNACFVCLASGTKTARAFIYELAEIAKSIEPKYSLVEVTSDSKGCLRYLNSVPFAHKIVNYTTVSERYPPHDKYILLDFGGRDGAVAKAAESINGSYADAELIVVSIGGEAKVYDQNQAQERRARAANLGALQMNATGIRDSVMEREGERQYFDKFEAWFSELVHRQSTEFDGKVLNVTLREYTGLQGEEGLEGLWNRFCQGEVSGDDGIVVRLDGT